MYRCAVIGLGNIGFAFSFDAKREGTWTHVDAYSRCILTKLVGVVEIEPATIHRFRTVFPEIPVYRTVDDLFGEQEVDIVSVAVPTRLHGPVFDEILKHSVKAIFCEKPMSDSLDSTITMLESAKNKKVITAVNYTRRWQNTFMLVKEMVKKGDIGNLKAIHAYYPGQIFNIGSHLFDTLRMLSSAEPLAVSAFAVGDNGDPSYSGWIACTDDIIITFNATGAREDLIFEIDLVGDEGRIRILDNGDTIEWNRFRESKRYSGYRELVRQAVQMPPKNDRFLDAICDIADVLSGKKENVECSGSDGFMVDTIIDAVMESGKQSGRVVQVTAVNPP